jgi:hypothetical protein
MNPQFPDNGIGFRDPSGAVAVILLALLESLLLLALQQDLVEFGHRGTAQWTTLAIAGPTMLCLLIQSARDRYAWTVGAVLLVLLWLLAGYAGSQCADGAEDEVFGPYAAAMTVALFVLTPYLQVWRDHRRLPYALLFHRAWDNALTLAAAAVFAAAGWAILWLWASLFKIVHLRFFADLFFEARFAFPVTGLFAGLGVMLGRTQSGALRSLLNVCLALGRALLPLIALVAVIFLPTLAFTGLQPLWDTRHATPLLLCLVFGTVSLVNSVFQDGNAAAPYGRALRLLVNLALLSLPAYALIAAISLQLRIAQHGWSVDRLWAAVLLGFALLYALGYAIAALRRSGSWLVWLAPVNRLVALALVAVLLLTQSPLFNLRAISVHSQLARVERGDLPLDKLDLPYFRWQLGTPGITALKQLQHDPRVLADEALKARLDEILAQKQRWESPGAKSALSLSAVLKPSPASAVIPPALLQRMLDLQKGDNKNWPLAGTLNDCVQGHASCYLLAADLDRDDRPEWILARDPAARNAWPLFGEKGGEWRLLGYLGGSNEAIKDEASRKAFAEALAEGRFAVEAPAWQDLMIEGQRYRFREQPY